MDVARKHGPDPFALDFAVLLGGVPSNGRRLFPSSRNFTLNEYIYTCEQYVKPIGGGIFRAAPVGSRGVRPNPWAHKDLWHKTSIQNYLQEIQNSFAVAGSGGARPRKNRRKSLPRNYLRIPGTGPKWVQPETLLSAICRSFDATLDFSRKSNSGIAISEFKVPPSKPRFPTIKANTLSGARPVLAAADSRALIRTRILRRHHRPTCSSACQAAAIDLRTPH
jgi:hypothetical protein